MQDVVILYDRDDVIEFNKYNNKKINIFLVSPGLEYYLKNRKDVEIIKIQENKDSILQKKIITNSKKIYDEFEKNINILSKIDKGIIENIHNLFCASMFSFMYLVENLRPFKNFQIFHKKKIHKFDNFNDFIPLFLEKIFFKDNQDFFRYLRSSKLSKINKMFIKLNNLICKLGKKKNSKLISGSLLSKKILEECEEETSVFQIKPYTDFKKFHIIINLFSVFNLYKKKKIFYFFPFQEHDLDRTHIEKDLHNFFEKFNDKNFNYFKHILISPLIKYCQNQINFKKSILNFVDFIKPRYVFVDQLRFDVSTLLASICLEKKREVILVPHGSISIPSDEFSDFVSPIVARGLVYSKIANYSVAQSKISYEAIKYYDNKIKILKSKPILFGKKVSNKNFLKNKNFRFLHASTPKTLSAWPWIYENYNEYIENINRLTKTLNSKKGIELIIRFREGPECDLETFKKLINIDKYRFVKISKNKSFFEDLENSDCLISFSSTSIEEALFLNKKIWIHANNRKYKHINYNFKKDNYIFYSDEKDIDQKLRLIMNDEENKNYDVLWNTNLSEDDDLKKFL